MPLIYDGEITEATLQDLIANQILEDTELEYKNYDYPDGKFENQKNKNDLMAGITAFANTNGGYMILGIKEYNNVPVELAGVGFTSDKFGEWEKAFDNIVASLIRPLIHGIKCHKIETADGKVLIVVQIPKSYNRPHAVYLNGKYDFYMRRATGKYPMDIEDMRKQFLRADSFHQQMQAFRRDRIAMILSGDYPVDFTTTPNFVLHFMPEWSFELGNSIDLSIIARHREHGNLMYGHVSYPGYNADGCYLQGKTFRQALLGFGQIFRNGIAEFNMNFLFNSDGSIWWEQCQYRIIHNFLCYESIIKDYIPRPYYCAITLLNAKGYCDSYSNPHTKIPEHSITNNVVNSQIGVWEDGRPLLHTVRPIFDSLSNALGYEKATRLETFLNENDELAQ